jgi:hypothetical protein
VLSICSNFKTVGKAFMRLVECLEYTNIKAEDGYFEAKI